MKLYCWKLAKLASFFMIDCINIPLLHWKSAKLAPFFCDWLHKYTIDSPKISKIHIFYMLDFCLNWHFFFFSQFFETAFVNTQLFCHKSSNFALFLLVVKKMEHFCSWFFLNAWFVMHICNYFIYDWYNLCL